jgi:hypothetical protein
MSGLNRVVKTDAEAATRMRRWLRQVARLHPQAWRQRNGEEFDAVLEDAMSDWRWRRLFKPVQ